MSVCAVSLWQQVVKVLQEGAQQPGTSASPSSSDDEAVYDSIRALVHRLQNLPRHPQAVWQKLVEQEKVPLKLGMAFSRAVQHSWQSPPMCAAAVSALSALLGTAMLSGIIRAGVAVASGSLAASMQQQLQQAEVLPQFASVVSTTAEVLQAEAAAAVTEGAAGLYADDLGGCAQLLVGLFRDTCSLQALLKWLWAPAAYTDAANNTAWLCDPSGLAEAGLHLSAAALQNASALVQHALPALRQQHPQQAAALVAVLKDRCSTGVTLIRGTLATAFHAEPYQLAWQNRGHAADPSHKQMQQLLLSPHALPCLAAFWLSAAGRVRALADSQGSREQEAASRAGSSIRRSGSWGSQGSRCSGTGQPHRPATATAAAASSSSRSGSSRAVFGSPCESRLLQLLGLAPRVVGWLLKPQWACGPQEALQHALDDLTIALGVTEQCLDAALEGFMFDPWQEEEEEEDQQQREQEQEQQQQRRQQFEQQQQVWLLLLPQLLRCASSRLLLGTGSDGEVEQVALHATQLLGVCRRVHVVIKMLHRVQSAGAAELRPPHPAWEQEVLGALLLLGARLQLRQGPEQLLAQAAAGADGAAAAAPAPAPPTAAPGSAQPSSSTPPVPAAPSSTSDSDSTMAYLHALCAVNLVSLLSEVVRTGADWPWGAATTRAALQAPDAGSSSRLSAGPSSSSSSSSGGGGGGSSSSDGHATSDSAAAAATPITPPPVAERFAQVCAALEAALRTVAAAALQSSNSPQVAPDLGLLEGGVTSMLLSDVGGREGAVRPTLFRAALLLHMGLRGQAALAAEQRQFYSLLGTLLKLSRSCSRLGRGQDFAHTCCWAAGHAAARLLQQQGEGALLQRQAAAAAGASVAVSDARGGVPVLLSEVDCLPSLVIFGRYCLTWADQLAQQQHTGEQQQQQQQGGAGSAVPQLPLCGRLGCLLVAGAAVADWVADVTSREATTALSAAAAGGDGVGDLHQQLQQQLQALVALQQALRQDGETDALLSALVQQLQATGLLLSSVPVPHFCNYTACANISGPTEAGLVSRGSCLWGVPGCSLLRAGVSAQGLEAAQARVQGNGRGGSSSSYSACSTAVNGGESRPPGLTGVKVSHPHSGRRLGHLL